MFEQAYQIVADVLRVVPEQIRPDSSPDTIGTWDSLRHLDLVLALEHEFGVEFTPEEIEQMLSVELILSLLAEKTGVAPR